MNKLIPHEYLTRRHQWGQHDEIYVCVVLCDGDSGVMQGTSKAMAAIHYKYFVWIAWGELRQVLWQTAIHYKCFGRRPARGMIGFKLESDWMYIYIYIYMDTYACMGTHVHLYMNTYIMDAYIYMGTQKPYPGSELAAGPYAGAWAMAVGPGLGPCIAREQGHVP